MPPVERREHDPVAMGGDVLGQGVGQRAPDRDGARGRLRPEPLRHAAVVLALDRHRRLGPVEVQVPDLQAQHLADTPPGRPDEHREQPPPLGQRVDQARELLAGRRRRTASRPVVADDDAHLSGRVVPNDPVLDAGREHRSQRGVVLADRTRRLPARLHRRDELTDHRRVHVGQLDPTEEREREPLQ